ncbi:MAG: 2,3-bisphosphoglycerate-independent phosphoglycerate mutase [Deltaproteobacteria bacterium]|nr:2,3-bisphosphoglycerate-independent phosphoglycerate mutase [Deltaproteobacteria bacterium]
MRCILVILDGLGDRAHSVLKNRTPLQAAHTPHLDQLATMGMNGLYHPYVQGIPLSSEIAHFLIFGYDLEEFPGRGYIEAVGSGIEIDDTEVVLLCHFCSVIKENNKLILDKERPPVTDSERAILLEEVTPYKVGDITIRFVSTKGADGFLVLSGKTSPNITDSNPITEGLPLISVQPLDPSPEARQTAKGLNHYFRWLYQKLSFHSINSDRKKKNLPPINILATQRAGRKKTLEPFFEKWGLRGLSIAAGPLYWGLCQEIGMDVIKEKESNDPEKDLKERLRQAHEARTYDFIHVHTKMPDEAAHTKDSYYKSEVIEALDRAMVSAVQKMMPDPETLLVVTADHSTPSSGAMIHSGETVPLTMVGRYPRRDTVTAFNEIDCALGGLGPIRGKELMYLILNFLDRAKMKGLMDTTIDQPYTPGHYRPLTLEGE